MSSRNKTIIIGAGIGGLATGMLLASQGYEVEVYEKQAYIGGRCSLKEASGFRFDTGPTFLMMPHLLEELFAAADRNLHDYIRLSEVDPLYRLQFGDTAFYPSRNRVRMLSEISEVFPGHEAGYLRFMNDEEEKFNRVSRLLQQPFGRVLHYFTKDMLAALPKLHAWDTVYNRLGRYFTDERMKWAFTFQAKYLGMSPWECPGTFTMLSYLEHKFGLYHPEGGVNQICEAMARVLREHGGVIHTSAPVQEVLVVRGRAVGVLLKNGDTSRADDVVINADFGHAMTSLFEPGILKKYAKPKLDRKKFSCSTFMLYLGLNRKVHLSHHNVLFAEDYRRNVEDITHHHRLSEDPSIYIHHPGAIDPTMAPPGKTALYVLMPVPHLIEDDPWDEWLPRARELALKKVAREIGVSDIESLIEYESIITPRQWQEEYHVYKGATFNLAHNLGQMMYLRPHNQFEEVDHCYLVGGGTHPGSGIPTILESARISTALLMEQYPAQKTITAGVRL